MDEFADLTQKLEQMLQEAQSGGMTPDLMARLGSAVSEARTTVESAMSGLKQQAQDKAKEYREQAAAMQKEKDTAAAQARGEIAPEPVPHPWEDHQGLADATVQPLVAALMGLVAPPRPSTMRLRP